MPPTFWSASGSFASSDDRNVTVLATPVWSDPSDPGSNSATKQIPRYDPETTGTTVRKAQNDRHMRTLELSKADPGTGGMAASDLKHRYLWGPVVDQLFADEQITNVNSPGNTLWALGDQVGTIRDIADFNSGTSTFTVTNHRTFDSFGRLTAESNAAVDLAFAYTGKYFDEATGLSHHWHRWFDPHLGKWISEDPIGFAGGDANLGRYVINNTLSFRDSNGLDIVVSDGGLFIVEPFTSQLVFNFEPPPPPPLTPNEKLDLFFAEAQSGCNILGRIQSGLVGRNAND